MAGAEAIDVLVAYARPDGQRVIPVRVAAGSRVEDVIRQSGILTEFPELSLPAAKLGIFGRRVDPDHVPAAGDRIEIYRPLLADPKSVRRRRAEQAQRKAQ
jgi:putative ubiquitin-RnfH superfamily antitoxin RatB of RatAB toxin-antitoxin module